MATYYATSVVPPLVQQAQELAEQFQFTASSAPEAGRLLYVLTRHIHAGSVGEIGTGCGVGGGVDGQCAESSRPVFHDRD